MEKEIIELYKKDTELLYSRLILLALNKIKNLPEKREEYPDLIYLAISEKFLGLFRRDQNKDNLKISIILRRAAHKVHRILFKANKIKKSRKFLNII